MVMKLRPTVRRSGGGLALRSLLLLQPRSTAPVALVGLRAPAEINGLATYRVEVTESTVVPHSGSSPSGLILLCAGDDALKPICAEGDELLGYAIQWKQVYALAYQLQQSPWASQDPLAHLEPVQGLTHRLSRDDANH